MGQPNPGFKFIQSLYYQNQPLKDIGLYKVENHIMGHPVTSDYTVFGVHKQVTELTQRAFFAAKIEATVLSDKQGNKFFLVANEQKDLAIETLDNVKKGLTNLSIPEPKLNQIARGRKESVMDLNNIPDFYYNSLKESLSLYQIPFYAESIRKGENQIAFLASDKEKVKTCIKDIAEYMKSPTGKKEAKEFFNSELVFKQIVDNIKKNETIFVCFKDSDTHIKLTPNQASFYIAGKTTDFSGDIFQKEIWNDKLSYQIVSRPGAVVLSEVEFNSEQREDILNQKLRETVNSIDSTYFRPQSINEELNKVLYTLDNMPVADIELNETEPEVQSPIAPEQFDSTDAI